jgi:hypothetical protein
METRVRSKVEAHDKYQLELKFDYLLLEGKATRYKVVTYIFFPKSLGINADTYPAAHFYRDLQNYVRLKTPDFSLAEIASSPASPLVRAQNLLAKPDWVHTQGITDRLITNFKFLRAILKDALDTEIDRLQEALHGVKRVDDPTAALEACLEPALAETSAILTAYRNLGPDLKRRDVDARVLRSYTLTDEALSIVAEDAFLEMLLLIQNEHSAVPAPTCAKQLAVAIRRERFYRKSQHYASVLEPKADAGEFLFRVSVLKKFTSSVLYLSTSVRREGGTTEQILYALAAGISMIFATVIAFYAQLRFGNFTFALFVALVIGYMFKDRLKDSMRALSHRFMRSAFYDRRTRIRTLDGQHELGYLRERMAFIPESDVPATVMLARNRQVITELDNDGQGEEILRYEKAVMLRRNAVENIYVDAPPIRAVKDIMRLDVRDFLRKMDNPTQIQPYLKGSKVRRARLPRVYFLNIVQVSSVADVKEPVKTSRMRIRLTRKGIRRVELFS